MNSNSLGRAVSLLIAMSVVLTAQPERYRDSVMPKSWAARFTCLRHAASSGTTCARSLHGTGRI
jgi:hypothetical protein